MNHAKPEDNAPKMINRRAFLKTTATAAGAAVTASFCSPAFAAHAARRPPNVVLYLVDDLGYMDSTVYGSQYYETPNMERLAARGIVFTDAYAANPLCSPTRASILTGKYPARLGITTPSCHLPPLPDAPLYPERAAPHREVLEPHSRRFLPLEEYTLAEALRDAGYKTGFFGKWHLGRPEKYWPQTQGFDVNVGGGMWPGPPSYHSPYRISTLPDGPEGEYITDRLTDEALDYLEHNQHDPFFLCFWHYAVHAPFQDKEELRKVFLDKKDPRNKQNDPIMAAMIKSMDESLGSLLDKLDELGLADNTIIIFFSDNGGNEYDRVGPEQWLPTNNDPLRSGKGSVYEGGVRVPMIVKWPGVVDSGTRTSAIVSSIDFFPTILDMTGASPHQGQILDGLSLAPLLKSGKKLDREAIFCHMPHLVPSVTGVLNEPSTWVRKGPWKLIRFYTTTEEFPNRYELYNLDKDIGETRNLAERRPRKVRELDALIDEFLERTGAAVPKPNPAYDPAAMAAVDGWRPSHHCALYRKDGALHVKSTGNDPFVVNDAVPNIEGPVRVGLRMQSNASGEGFVFWTTDQGPSFGPNQRMPFTPVHDGQWHEYEVSFSPAGMLRSLRIDPAAASGSVQIDWIRIYGKSGELARVWDFDAFEESV
jgi:arylsulfatase A-like enzyme